MLKPTTQKFRLLRKNLEKKMAADLNNINSPRRLRGRFGTDGKVYYMPTLTCTSKTDVTRIIVDEIKILPIVFVPGTMGSNLKKKDDGAQVWRFDTLAQIVAAQFNLTPGNRQNNLHPDRTEVDSNGAIPNKKVGGLYDAADFRKRGWGEVSAASYQDFLVWLEEHFNNQQGDNFGPEAHRQLNKKLQKIRPEADWHPQKPYTPLTDEECLMAERWSYPVYAVGYNWLQSNEDSAMRLAKRINEIISINSSPCSFCEQVIVVTHSMGGLTARRCAQLPDMQSKIAGIVHGAMPAIGASVSYRRCKIGMWDEDMGASLVIGKTGKHITAVFAQSPGALELLPNTEYPSNWLKIRDQTNQHLPETPSTYAPFDGLYSEKTRWWGIVNEKWLSPKEGISITWDDFLDALKAAGRFHQHIAQSYHVNTWSFYGTGLPSFENITWAYSTKMNRHNPTPELLDLSYNDARLDGTGTEYVIRKVKLPENSGMSIEKYSDVHGLEIRSADEMGDGTVPVVSGRAPLNHVHQIFELRGFEHQKAYDAITAREVTAYAITKIAASVSNHSSTVRNL